MEKFTETGHCTFRVHCRTCRSDEAWRKKIMSQFEWDGECPHGFAEDNLPESPQMPPVAKQALSLAEAVGRAFKALVTGEQVIADEATRKSRIEICEGCDQLSGARCVKCGCYTSKKIVLQTERCPLRKW